MNDQGWYRLPTGCSFQRVALAVLVASSGCATVQATLPAGDFSQRLTLPFRLRGGDGRVTVRYGTNHDAKRWGFDLLGLPFDLKSIEGFPVFEASVDYPTAGYRGVMGWVQLVTVTDTKTGVAETTVDQLPIFRDLEVPFMALGAPATAFDAPGPNPPRTDETWTAWTFLTICPDVGRTKRLVPVIAVRWGHVLVDGKATAVPVEAVSLDHWDRLAPVLRSRFPSWRFLPAGSVEL